MKLSALLFLLSPFVAMALPHEPHVEDDQQLLNLEKDREVLVDPMGEQETVAEGEQQEELERQERDLLYSNYYQSPYFGGYSYRNSPYYYTSSSLRYPSRYYNNYNRGLYYNTYRYAPTYYSGNGYRYLAKRSADEKEEVLKENEREERDVLYTTYQQPLSYRTYYAQQYPHYYSPYVSGYRQQYLPTYYTSSGYRYKRSANHVPGHVDEEQDETREHQHADELEAATTEADQVNLQQQEQEDQREKRHGELYFSLGPLGVSLGSNRYHRYNGFGYNNYYNRYNPYRYAAYPYRNYYNYYPSYYSYAY